MRSRENFSGDPNLHLITWSYTGMSDGRLRARTFPAVTHPTPEGPWINFHALVAAESSETNS